MVNKTRKKSTVTVIIALCGLVLGIGIVYLSGAFRGKEADPYRQNSSQQSTDQSEPETRSNNTSDEEEGAPSATDQDATSTKIDPATVSSIQIDSLGIEVSYVKGIGGFEYRILRTQAGTTYAEFRNADLVGTKCTDDNGAFASIIVNPSANEDTSTISQKVTLDNKVYGLSLIGTNCTSNTTLFAEYQDSFKSAFSLLKKIESN